MQLNPISSSPVRLGGPQPAGARQAGATSADQAQFPAAESLDQALRATPDIRSEAVARAERLLSSVKYPPTEVIEGISRLLARHGR